MRTGKYLVYSLLDILHLEECLAHKKYSMDIYWLLLISFYKRMNRGTVINSRAQDHTLEREAGFLVLTKGDVRTSPRNEYRGLLPTSVKRITFIFELGGSYGPLMPTVV